MTMAAAGVIRRRHLMDDDIQWLCVKPWMCSFGQCNLYPVLYRCIRMAIKIASDLPAFLSLLILLLATTVANNYGVVNIK
jgi:hypothetical protein